MAGWIDRLVPASFRGAGVKVDKAEREIGRRTVTFTYPQRDTPFVEDLGLHPRVFSIDGYVGGRGDYFPERDALIAAIDTPGPGTLVHPYYGTLQVAVTGCHIEELTTE